jgi:UPF0271 protein
MSDLIRNVDLNCDMGEIPALLADGSQDALLDCVTSVNISCGAHAGDADLIRATIQAAIQRGVQIGAHPGYPDPVNFGRVALDMDPKSLAAEITRQLVWFAAQVDEYGGRIRHVKPHGALYNVAVRDKEIAGAISAGVASWRRSVILVGLAGTSMLDVFRQDGFEVWGEAFADRTYEPDGTLRSRLKAGALIVDPTAAAEQAAKLARDPTVDTICIHSDTPNSVEIARAVALRCRT